MQKIFKREIDYGTHTHLAWGIALDKEGFILSIELISRNGLDEHTFLPVQILSVPIQKEARGFVLIHNHAPGQLTPTESDKAITARLIHCGNLLQMPLLDHLIVDGKDYYSFRDEGLMEQLETDPRYDPPVYSRKEFEADLENTETERDQLLYYIVSLMHEAEYPIEAIIAKTGLSIPVILALISEEDEIDPDSHYETSNGHIKGV